MARDGTRRAKRLGWKAQKRHEGESDALLQEMQTMSHFCFQDPIPGSTWAFSGPHTSQPERRHAGEQYGGKHSLRIHRYELAPAPTTIQCFINPPY